MTTLPPEAAPEASTADAPAVPSAQAEPATSPETNPAAGGCYLRDPQTGALTLITPSTVQE